MGACGRPMDQAAMRRLHEVEAEKNVLEADNQKLQSVLETERGVLREVMATARKAVGEMNRQNEILKKRVAELEASGGSSGGAGNADAIFNKDLEIQRLQIKLHESELELRKAKRGADHGSSQEHDYSGAGILVTRIQRECGLRMLNSMLKSSRRRRFACGFAVWSVVTKGKLLSKPRGMTASGHLVDAVPCTITTKWTTADNCPNFDHAEGTVDAHRAIGSTTFNMSSATPAIPAMATKVSVLFEIADAAKQVAKVAVLSNKSPPRSRHRAVEASPRSPRGKINPRQRDIVLPKSRHSYSDHLNYSPRER